MTATIGVDVGTTGCKVAVVSDGGEILATAQAAYPLETPAPGAAELDPILVWSAVTTSIKAACAAPGVAEPPRALAITAAGEALVPLDDAAAPLSNIITSIDTRSRDVFERSLREIGGPRFSRYSGLDPLPHYSLFRWRWFAETRPDVYARTALLAGHTEWLAAGFGAAPAIDRSLAARSLAYRCDAGAWDDELLALMGLDAGRLGTVVEAGTASGAVRPELAAELGLRAGAPVVVAGLDQACAALALALPGPEVAMLSIGTTAVLGLELCDERFGPEAAARGIPVTPHIRPRYRIALAGTPAGGALLRWFDTRILAQPHDPVAQLDGIADHRTEVLALPHLGGSRAAFGDPGATGALLGLRFATDRRDIVRALLDGVAYEVAVMLERLQALGPHTTRLRAAGGGSCSQAWLQTIADATGLPVETTATAFGAAIGAAAVARQASPAAGAADAITAPVERTVEPRHDWSGYHADRLRRFTDSYAALASERGSHVPTP